MLKQILPAIVPALLSLLSDLITTLLNPLIERYNVKKYAGIMTAVYAALDPFVKNNLAAIGSNELYQAYGRTVAMLSDGSLSASEITTVTNLLLQKFDITIAATAPSASPVKEPLILSQEVDQAVADFKAKQAIVLDKVKTGAAGLLGTAEKSFALNPAQP